MSTNGFVGGFENHLTLVGWNFNTKNTLLTRDSGVEPWGPHKPQTPFESAPATKFLGENIMSWSINLTGPKEMVLCELEQAGGIIRQAQDAVCQANHETVTVSVSGHIYNSTNSGGSGVSFSLSSNNPVPEAPVEVVSDTKEEIPY